MTAIPEFAEISDRIYEVRVVPGPLRHEGRYARALVDHDEQQILVSDEVPEEDRKTILEKAVSAALGLAPEAFRPVPVVGSIA